MPPQADRAAAIRRACRRQRPRRRPNRRWLPSPHRRPEGGRDCALAAPVARLPVELDVAVPVREFRVRNLLALEPGQVIESQWAHGEDMPLAAGDVQLAWSEFEVVDTQLAVRRDAAGVKRRRTREQETGNR